MPGDQIVLINGKAQSADFHDPTIYQSVDSILPLSIKALALRKV
jgi:hypothetical protein